MGSKVGRLRTGGRHNKNDAKVWRRRPVRKSAAAETDTALGVTWLRWIKDHDGKIVGGIASTQNTSGILPDVTGLRFPDGCNLTATALSPNDWPYSAVSPNEILSKRDCISAAPAIVVATGNASNPLLNCLHDVQFSCRMSEAASLTLIVLALAAACGGFACMASDCPRPVAPRNSDRREARLLDDNSDDGSVFHASEGDNSLGL